ncbi:MAG TPA: tyrosine-type recombinase/integrase, partial [Gammaproteobacteria bacterium]|nr:tyrosine-type recombinase/integrase [Gammaproteobacteria bacterium]
MPARTFSTDRELKALKPSDKHYDVKDEKARNHIVRVGPENAKGEFRRTFCLVTRFPGSKNPTRHAFGEYKVNGKGDLTLEEARELAGEWRAMIRKNVDPREAGRREKTEASRKRDVTFGAVIEEYLARHVVGQRKAKDVEREIRSELIESWQNKPISEITRGDVVELVEAIADRPAPYHAHNVFGHIRTFFNWCIDRGKYDLETSPCDRLKPARLIGAKKPRQRVLTDDELLAFSRTADRLGYPFGPMFKLLVLTGQRKSEVAEARWREFNLDRSIWTVPPERFKSDSSHLVPLTDDVLAVLRALPRFKKGDHLFSTTFGEKPVSGFSKAKARLDRLILRTLKALARTRGEDPAKVTLPPFVIHDIRRTMRTRLSGLKVQERVAEMVIGHGKKGLARVYDQHEFADEMREA